MKKIISEDVFSLNAWNGLSNRILEAAPDGLVLVDREGRILAVNRQTLRMFGYEREELVGREIEMLIPERFRDGHVRLRDEFMGTTGTRPMGAGKTLFGCRRDGSEFPVDIGLSPIGAGPGIRVAAFIRDISLQNKVEEDLRRSREGLEKRVQERTSELVKANYALESEINKKKKVESRLREEGERAQKYLDLAGVIFVAIDTRQNVILLNRKGCELLGVGANEAVGKNWFDHFIPEPERERTREAFKNLISGRIEPVE
ncbi:MAG TPA: PAS domain S-box protein, partial [Nitrospiria bacterium]|nr:PAS domain S-box protein [Nitrospiria bacterium]